MHAIDWAILPLYLIGITLLGAQASRKVKSSSDFFMPRRFGKLMMLTFAFGTGTSSDQAVSVAAASRTNGLSAIWWQWLWLPATPFYWLIAPIMRRFRALTTADVYELRYDRSVGVLFATVGVVSLAAKIGLLLKGIGAMIEPCTGGVISAEVAILITTVLFVTYGMAGGLGAAIVTDFIQGIMTVLFSALLLPFVLSATGGLAGMREILSDYNPALLELTVPGKIDTFFVFMYSLQALVGIVAFPFIMGVCGAGRTEMDGRVGFMFGNLLKRLCTMAWSLTALAAMAWYLKTGVDPTTINKDHFYGEIATAFLPDVFPGLLGIFLACLLASIMSSCDAIMISSAALFTENVYRRLRPDFDDKHYIGVGRLASLVVVACGVVFALTVPDVVKALDFWFKISPQIGIAFWVGLLWRRATPAGAWASTIAAVATWFLAAQDATAEWLATHEWIRESHIVVTNRAGDLELNQPWVIAAYLTAGLLACLIVSLLTSPADPTKLQRFYDLTRTPVAPDEVIPAPCELPAGVTPPQRRMLCTWGGLEIPLPSRTSWLGFVAGWVMVGLLVGGFMAIIG